MNVLTTAQRQAPLRLSLLTLALMSAAAHADEAPRDDIEHIAISAQRLPFRGDAPLNSLPQAVNVVEASQLASQGISTFQDSIDLSSGISRQNSLGGMWDSFAIRGFSGDENLPGGYLINGYSAGRGYSGRRDTVNIQSIEVLKGPGSALYGRSEPGGTINIITKKPQYAPEGYLQLSLGSYDHYRAEVDYTNAINQQAAFRVTGAYEDNGSFRDTVKSKKWFFSPSLNYQLSERTTLNYELELLQQKIPFDRGVAVQNNDFAAVDIHTFYGEPSDGPMQIDAQGHQLSLNHELANNWLLIAGVGYRDSRLKGYSTEADLSGSRQLLNQDGHTLSRQRRYRDYQAEDLSARVELSGSASWLVTHHLLMGIDGYRYQLDSEQQHWRVTAGDDSYSVEWHHPEYGQIAPPLTLTQNDREQQRAYGIYLQDQLDLSEHWKALLGVRFDHFSQTIDNHMLLTGSRQHQDQLNPRAGLVYQASEDISWYVSYAEGFRPNTGRDINNQAFDPESSKSIEAGVKFALFEGSLSGTLALFNAEKSNILAADPLNAGYTAALGEAKSQGLELDANLWLSDSTQLAVAYAYTDAQTKNAVTNADWGIDIPAGSPLVNIPKHKLNLTLTQELPLLSDSATVGVNATYVAERLGDTVTPSYQLPSYTLVRVFANQPLGRHWQLHLSIDNLLNKTYFASSYSPLWTQPGEPRSATLSIKYLF